MRRPVQQLAETIPDDLLNYLRFAAFPEGPPGKRELSDLFNEIVFFGDAPEVLSWLEAAWRRHEALIRHGVEGEPFILKKMRDLRRFINGGELPADGN
jgi:hypothetical protein